MKDKNLKISGKISYSVKIKYKWLTEPDACEKCLSMHGNLYDKEEVPPKPHPNCRCHVEEISIIDPEISTQYEFREEIMYLKKEALRLLGNVHILKNSLDTLSLKLINILKELNIQNTEIENEKHQLQQEINILENKINVVIDELNSHSVIYNVEYIRNKSQEISDLQQELHTLNNKIDYFKSKCDKWLVDLIVKLGEKLGPDAAALWKIAASKFEEGKDYIKKNGYLVKKVSDLKNPKLEKIIKEKLSSQKLNTNSKGIIFHSKSSLANSIINSYTFKDFIKKNIVELSLNDKIKDTSLSFRQDINNFLAIRNCDIIDIYIDNQNTIHAKIIDTVDYNSGEWLVALPHNAQEHGLLENYYIIVEIEYPYEKWKRYLD